MENRGNRGSRGRQGLAVLPPPLFSFPPFFFFLFPPSFHKIESDEGDDVGDKFGLRVRDLPFFFFLFFFFFLSLLHLFVLRSSLFSFL